MLNEKIKNAITDYLSDIGEIMFDETAAMILEREGRIIHYELLKEDELLVVKKFGKYTIGYIVKNNQIDLNQVWFMQPYTALETKYIPTDLIEQLNYT